jgi:hypothetical protein
MDIASITPIVTGAFTSIGGLVLTVLTAVVAFGIAMLGFRFGYRKLHSVVR